MKLYRRAESWIYNGWRPAIAWSYLVICIFDFLIGPILSPVFQSMFYPGQEYVPWKPNTLAEGGLYHASMLAIVGVTAWGRTQEKIRALNMFGDSIEVETETHTIEPVVKKPTPRKPRRRRRQ